jgi:hypothetical protein
LSNPISNCQLDWVIQTSENNSVYYENFTLKRLEDLAKKWESLPKTEANQKQRIFEAQQSFIEALKDCVNDLDSRLKKLEAKNQ